MSKAAAREIRAAYEAAAWYQRLEDGLSATERWRYLRWLKTSSANVGAMLFLGAFCDSLRRGQSVPGRHRRQQPSRTQGTR